MVICLCHFQLVCKWFTICWWSGSKNILHPVLQNYTKLAGSNVWESSSKVEWTHLHLLVLMSLSYHGELVVLLQGYYVRLKIVLSFLGMLEGIRGEKGCQALLEALNIGMGQISDQSWDMQPDHTSPINTLLWLLKCYKCLSITQIMPV